MAKPKQIVLTENGVITQAALAAYVEGRLSDTERAEMDRLIQDDPFAQEALEGLRGSSSLGTMPEVITTINTHLREKTGARERKAKGIVIPWMTYAYIAVILVVLIGVGFALVYLMQNRAQNQSNPKGQESVPIVEPAKVDTVKMDTNKVVPPVNDSMADQTDSSKAISDPNDATAPAKEDAQTTSNMSEKVLDARSPATPEIAAKLGVGKAYFEASDYINAEKTYNEVLAKQPDNLDALYFGGVASYLNETKGLGEANFDKLIKAGFYTDGTKWYKANILIRRGQKGQAKELLRDLVNSNSLYKDRAIKKYEELYKKLD